MQQFKLGEMEQKFADLIWSNVPISTRMLIELCEEKFSWKRTTTYTMLKRLCKRGIFQNENGLVSALMSKDEFGAAQGKELIDEAFSGSLPQFLVAFTQKNKLSSDEVKEILSLISQHKE